MVVIRNPDAPATAKQLWALHELTGEDTRNWQLSKQEASDRIEALELKKVERELPQAEVDEGEPFSEAHVRIVEGDQRSGKT